VRSREGRGDGVYVLGANLTWRHFRISPTQQAACHVHFLDSFEVLVTKKLQVPFSILFPFILSVVPILFPPLSPFSFNTHVNIYTALDLDL
jgi:hypothetical protein